MLVVGGRVGVLGSVIGVLVLTPLPEMLRAMQGLQHIIYGGVLVLCLLFVPNGLASIPSLLRARRKPAAPSAPIALETRP